MRVQLIHPPAFLNPTALTALRPSLPLGLAYIAGSARAAGHDVSIIDAVGDDPNLIVRIGKVAQLGTPVDGIVAAIAPETQVIGVSAMFTYQWFVVRELIQAIKAARPDVLVVGGGEHFTGLPAVSLEQSPVDILVIGEGEEIFVDLLKRYEAWHADHQHDLSNIGASVCDWAEGLAGTVYRRDDEIVPEERRARILDVDNIPAPAWELFDVKGYDENRLINGVRSGRTMPVLATRGCPYRCRYCSSANAWTTKWVAREPKQVVDEIEGYVETYGATNFPFQDLTAILKRDWILDFCNELIDRDLKITWQLPTGTRCEVIDDEVAALLRRSGSMQLNFAPESGSEEVRKKIAKQMKEESLFNAVKAAVGQGINVTCFFVLGFPRDNVEAYRDTARWAARLAKLGVDDAAVGFFFPIPGTSFFKELEDEGRAELDENLILAPIFVHDRWLTENRNYSVTLSAATLTYWRYRIVWAFYSRAVIFNPKRWLRIVRNFYSGREDSKFDSFLQILKERFITKRAAKVSTPPGNSR
ncbi:MAG: anaerobic magnesium-protoporphyrin IX monomethyl ester cyclase [Pseudohongiellaceae bacterium]|jgi:anaerobic magnesium-protoporphyrin IX monomethyl ester cyclase